MKVDILAIGAHPDDVELGVSGTLLHHIAMGKKVAILDLTEGELGSRGTIETRYAEAKAAAEILGISARVNINIGDGFFELSKQNKIKIIEQIRFFKPEVVLVNAINDRHPDHGRANELARDACFLAGLLKIETTYNDVLQEKWRPKSVYSYIQDRYIKPDFIVDITPYVDQKIAAILAYKTQFFNPNLEGPKTPISGEDFIHFLKGRWADFGRSIGVEFGEGFNVERPLGIKNILELD
jgi:bacillithiol biosynthesis deacetylase BshB1